jgi:hypothetical protein
VLEEGCLFVCLYAYVCLGWSDVFVSFPDVMLLCFV